MTKPYMATFYFRCDSEADESRKVAAMQAALEAHTICRKWVARLGLGFHPDTGGLDYAPALSPNDVEEYNSDMERLFAIASDPYESAIEAWKSAGLI